MGISFFKVPNHRVFHYEPRYWDERKERREMVKNETLREKAEWKDESYRPGMYISGKFQEQARNNRRGSLSKNLTRIIGLVSVATFLALLYFFAKYATIVLEGIR